MNPEIEKQIRKIMAADIKIKMLEAEIKGLPINKEEILLILEEITK